MLTVMYSLNSVIMILLPIGLGIWLARRLGTSWSLFFAGAATFIGSQVLHIPFLRLATRLFQDGTLPSPPPGYQLLFNAAFLGLAAGVFEEVARYLVLRYGQTRARSWPAALMFGAGHGGSEAIILGGLAAIALAQLSALRTTDLSTLKLSAGELAALQQQLSLYWSLPWPAALLGALERLFALVMHLSLSVMVMQVFTRRNWLWLPAAILWHAVVDGVAVYAQGSLGLAEPVMTMLWLEGIVGLFALACLGLIFALRQPEPPAPEPPAVPGPRAAEGLTELPELTAEALNATRYQ